MYIYDTPTVIVKEIEDEMKISETQYNLLFSVYAFPNMILPMIGGMIIQKKGIRAVLLFTTIIIGVS